MNDNSQEVGTKETAQTNWCIFCAAASNEEMIANFLSNLKNRRDAEHILKFLLSLYEEE